MPSDLKVKSQLKLQSVINFNCDFTLLPGALVVHYNFETKKEIVSCQFYVSFVGETFFLRDVCKLYSVVNLDCDVTMLPAALEVGKREIVNINLKK